MEFYKEDNTKKIKVFLKDQYIFLTSRAYDVFEFRLDAINISNGTAFNTIDADFDNEYVIFTLPDLIKKGTYDIQITLTTFNRKYIIGLEQLKIKDNL